MVTRPGGISTTPLTSSIVAGGVFVIGTLIVLGLAGYFLRRRQAHPAPSTPPPADEGPQPLA